MVTMMPLAESIRVVNNDVYVAGYESIGFVDVAKLWKNGSATNLTDGTHEAKAYSVAVDNNDVYVVGYEFIDGYHVAKIWKNGVGSNLTDLSVDAKAYSVAVENNNVYVAGYKGLVATLWINGEANSLSTGNVLGNVARSVTLNNSDVYVVGYVYEEGKTIAKIWKNGQSNNLTESTEDTVANSIYLH